MVTSIVERGGVKGGKEVEVMVEVGRVGKVEDTGESHPLSLSSHCLPFILIFMCAPKVQDDILYFWTLYSISGRVVNTAMGTARGSIVTATTASASTDMA